MQAILGTAIFVLVVLFAAGVASYNTKELSVRSFLLAILSFLGVIVGCYIVFGAVGGLFWVIWWIGIVIREILQWLVEALLYPWHWLFQLF